MGPILDDMTTALDIADKVIQLADQNPDFVYTSPVPSGDCLYVHDGKGSCVLGQALLALRVVDVEYLDKNKDFRIPALIRDLVRLGRIEVISEHHPLITYLNLTQMDQDRGKRRADAVAQLREYVGKFFA